ncbi:MAG: GMC family oxidoreductase N-terminal domain-containing protein, partial [Rhodoferax sp.]
MVIIGSGVGGGAVAYQLAKTALKVLILERGPLLPREEQNWDPEEVFVKQRYRTKETWWSDGRKFNPGMFYFVGGHTKFYGTAMFRFRERDFEEVVHPGGISPQWPIKYTTLEPWYALAETLFGVRGEAGLDPCEPPRSSDFAYAPVPNEPVVDAISKMLKAQGLNPFSMPSAVDFGLTGRCKRCANCDAFPCKIDAKGDAETCLIQPALRNKNIQLRTNAFVEKLETDSTGKKVVAAIVTIDSRRTRITANTFVVSAGAINSSALLLRSANVSNPQGLANSSGVVGRNYMTHNTTALMAVHPFKLNHTKFPKTLAIHDFYFGDQRGTEPLGSLQLLGKIREPMLRGALPLVPKKILSALAARSVDWYAQSEDLPHPESRVTVRPDGAINLHWHRTNLKTHEKWVS